MTVDYRSGDVLDQLAGVPDASVDLVCTSPPFWRLRDYGSGLPGQWGQEPSPGAFIDHLLELTVELRRVLTPHGSIAIELGDSYAGSGGAGGDYDSEGMRAGQSRYKGTAAASRTRPDGNGKVYRGGGRQLDKRSSGVPLDKSLSGTPALFAWSLAYGRNLLNPEREIEPWLIRNVIAWARDNPPVGALSDKVRPATSYITVATPSASRWFDLDAVRRPNPRQHETARVTARMRAPARGGTRETNDVIAQNPAGAPPLDHWHDEIDGDLLWLINTQSSSLAHYAMWPPKLVERLVLSMCPAQVCRQCREPRRRLVEREPSTVSPATIGWSDCGHGDDWRPGHVLDPFAGTGTTLAVADILGRDATGIDLDPANPGLYPARWAQCWRALRPDAGPSPITPAGEQLGLAL